MIVLTIPFIDKDQADSAYKCSNGEFKWIEYRLDYSSDPVSIPTDMVTHNTILTYRDRSEGGLGKLDFTEKVKFLAEFIRERNCLIDVELKLYDVMNLPADNLILSYHDLSGEFNFSQLEEIVLKANRIPAKFLKLALPVNSYKDLTRLEKLISASNKPVFLAGLGKLSRQTRILHKHLGALGTFIGLNDQLVIKDQLSLSEALIYQLNKISKHTKITGLVGREQVYNSIGIGYYNNLFQENDTDAVYIPFYVDDFTDFQNWVQVKKDIISGLSITMPFKRKVSELSTSQFATGNLYFPINGKVMNTDVAAFNEAIFQLHISNDKKILIIGSGATAETALITFKEFSNIIITCRNHKSANTLAEKYDHEFVAPHNLGSHNNDVVINCTPLGMQGENPLDLYNINLPHQVIDLPYRDADTPLITLCREHGIDYVDGRTFWHWQAKLQIEEFYKCFN